MKIKWTVYALLFLSALSAYGQSSLPVIPHEQQVQISFINDKSGASPVDRNAKWERFCQKFGKSLLIQNEAGGFVGAFSCLPMDSTVGSAVRGWYIRLIERKRFLDLEVSHGLGPAEQLVHSYSFRLEGDAFDRLLAHDGPLVLARMLVENLPTGWVY
ncbi:MAG: hypothetical protein M3Q07_05180, partial [Pseudobdellovibrionaceae bacterium]|nr:hypothetical protein [Pseudobdellovibrionaceae bacterium]